MTFDEWWNHPDLQSGSKVKPLATDLVRYGWDAAKMMCNEVLFAKHFADYLKENPDAQARFDAYWQEQCNKAIPLEDVMKELE